MIKIIILLVLSIIYIFLYKKLIKSIIDLIHILKNKNNPDYYIENPSIVINEKTKKAENATNLFLMPDIE